MTIKEKSIDFVSGITDHKIATLERVSFICGAKWMQSELMNLKRSSYGGLYKSIVWTKWVYN